ncbi:meiotic recombination protein SPO11 [Bombyx mandarina]|uniref:DNA topoisomerase (ATP-hydrolyzing) n=1 Tax=Bombyx mandarina TaxID=7092 RepID=A0A6J2KBZ5_BOMMA|nr:meiotic recombination protein SPO11 [Bombyx mandarina]
MELIHKQVPMLRDLALNPVFSFKQDLKLIAAIDKLAVDGRCDMTENKNVLTLPERKLGFSEVQQMLKGCCENKAFQSLDIKLNEKHSIRKSLIKKVEEILNAINEDAENGNVPKLVIRNQRLWSNCVYDLDRVTLKCFNEAKTSTITYSSSEDKTRFNTIVFVLTKVHELLIKNLTVTRRELFYQNVIRLRNQANLDVAVRDVCCLLDTPPWNLGIVATAKGLIAGPLTIKHRDGFQTDCMASGGVLIPQDVNGIIEFQSTAKYILVVEKDAIFQKLLDEGALIRLGPVIILTGKGYPDVCTRQLLCRLCKELRLRALALVDADPHGYEIFLTYKYGSLAQSHLSSSLACSSIVMLGARHHDAMTLAPTEARLALTERDKRKLLSLLKRPYLDNSNGGRIREELQVMLSSGTKAEIEALAPTSGELCDAYLPAKLIQGDYLG